MNAVQDYDIEDLKPGMTASFAKTVTEADMIMYAGVSCDFNAVHLCEEYAKTTLFGGRIAHGMLSVGFISAEQLTELQALRCTNAQGYYMSQPLDEEGARALLSRHFGF